MVMRSTGLAGLWLALLVAGRTTAGVATEEIAPDFALKSTAGPNLRLSEYRGNVVMLAFWASWCGGCRAQLRAFDALHASYERIGFTLLSVNLDPSIAQARETAASLGVSYPVLSDPDGTVGELYAIEDVPTVVFIDRDGRVRDVVEGFNRTNEDYYADRLRALLRE